MEIRESFIKIRKFQFVQNLVRIHIAGIIWFVFVQGHHMAGISEEDQGVEDQSSEDAETKYRAEEKAVITSSTQESRKESTIVQEEEFVKSKQEFIESKQEFIQEQVVESKQEFHQESKKESIVMHHESSQKESMVQEDIESMVVESSTTQSSTRKESVQQMETFSSQEQTTELLAERLEGMTLTQDSTVQVIYVYFCIKNSENLISILKVQKK
mgnify:FL=1